MTPEKATPPKREPWQERRSGGEGREVRNAEARDATAAPDLQAWRARNAAAWAAGGKKTWDRTVLRDGLGGSATRLRVLLYLGTRANWRSGECDATLSSEKIASAIDVDPRHVRRAVAWLRVAGWIVALDSSARGTRWAVAFTVAVGASDRGGAGTPPRRSERQRSG